MNTNLETMSRIFGRGAIIGLVTVSIWFAAQMSGLIFSWHGRMFGLTEHECALLSYGGMGLLKMLVLTFFVFPWIAIQLELKRRKKS